MIVSLPPLFEERMRRLLGEESDSFFASYREPARHGLRLNPLKAERDLFLARQPFALKPVPWCADGFQYPADERPGKHPYHAAGLYYIQEPSAMAPAEVLGARPGEAVLDLCAAPGGKTTQLAAAMRGEGLLVANEIHAVRAKALSENVERLGITHAVVTNEPPERLADRFPAFFDRILVDAPCSGEGMFRKLPEAVEDWSPDKVAECHRLQSDILDAAARMLKPGGTLVYSTCTFAPVENEESVLRFLESHPEFRLAPIPGADHFAPGHPEWTSPAQPGHADLFLAARLWPHRLEGEGHFVALLVKEDTGEAAMELPKKGRRRSSPRNLPGKEALGLWRSFARDAAPGALERTPDDAAFALFGDQLYYSPHPQLDWSGLKVVRGGWHLGTVKKNRLEPSHALALALSAEEAARRVELPAESDDVQRYLRGETLQLPGENGWTLVTVDGWSLGWGKQTDGQLKNHYPKGLRWLS